MEELYVFSKFFSRPRIQIMSVQYWSLRYSKSLDLFQDDVAQFTIFSRLSIRARMSVLITYLDPLRKDEINEYKVKGIRTNFYF